MAADSKGRAFATLKGKALSSERIEHDVEDVEAEDGDHGIVAAPELQD
jgi:hypothetical protein